MGSNTRDKWLSVGYKVVVAVLNAFLIVVLSIGVGNGPAGPLGRPARKLRARYVGPGKAG